MMIVRLSGHPLVQDSLSGCFEEDIRRFMCDRAYHITGLDAPAKFAPTLNESTNVGVKTGGSRVGGPELCVWADGNRRQGTRCFYPGSGPLDGGKTLLLLD